MTLKPGNISAIRSARFLYTSYCSNDGSSDTWKRQKFLIPFLSINAVRAAAKRRRKSRYSSPSASVSQPKMRFFSPSTSAIIFGACSAPHWVNRCDISKYLIPQRLHISIHRSSLSKPNS